MRFERERERERRGWDAVYVAESDWSCLIMLLCVCMYVYKGVVLYPPPPSFVNILYYIASNIEPYLLFLKVDYSDLPRMNCCWWWWWWWWLWWEGLKWMKSGCNYCIFKWMIDRYMALRIYRRVTF